MVMKRMKSLLGAALLAQLASGTTGWAAAPGADREASGFLEAFGLADTPVCFGLPPSLSSVPRSKNTTLLATGASSDFTLLMVEGTLPNGLLHHDGLGQLSSYPWTQPVLSRDGLYPQIWAVFLYSGCFIQRRPVSPDPGRIPVFRLFYPETACISRSGPHSCIQAVLSRDGLYSRIQAVLSGYSLSPGWRVELIPPPVPIVFLMNTTEGGGST
jgi:hypothetical protein